MMINLVLAKQQHLIVYFKMPAKTFFFRTAAFQTPSQSSLSLKFGVVRDTEGQTIGNRMRFLSTCMYMAAEESNGFV